jgi:hypothetical protein
MKELYSRNWDFTLYEIDNKVVITVVFFGPVDIFRSFYLLSEELTKDYEALKAVSEKIRNNYDFYKIREIIPAILE